MLNPEFRDLGQKYFEQIKDYLQPKTLLDSLLDLFFDPTTKYDGIINKIDEKCRKGWEELEKADQLIATAVSSISPEDKYGPSGFDASDTGPKRRFVSYGRELPYRIDFWNREDAPAPTQDVIITDQLDTDLDWSTLSFTEFGFLKWRVALEGGPYFNVDVDLRPDMNLIVNVEGRFDRDTGAIRWEFHALDPATRQPPEDPMAGFLPPITDSGYEIGWVNYTVNPKSGLATGTRIENQAFVKFDVDVFKPAPADGPFLNTIDAGTPTSIIGSLPAQQTCFGINLSWSGSDDAGGSGIRGYSIYVSDNGSPYSAWLAQTTVTSSVFTGQSGHTYSFYSIAEDNVGNREAAPPQPDATITVTGTLGLLPTEQAFNAIGGAGSVAVSASGGCSWTAASNAVWITIASGGQSSGNATVQYSVSPNTTTATRTGTLTIAGQTFTVSQAGNSSSCTFALSQLSQAFTPTGGYGNVSVRAPGGCVWTVASPSPWITISSVSGSGDGAVDFSVTANAGPISRAAILDIAGQSFSVIQAGTGGAGVTGIFYPRLLNTQAGATNPDSIEFTGIAVANLSGANAALTFTAFDASGSLITGSGITNPASLELKAGEQMPVIDYQLFGAGLIDREIPGWFKVESAAGPVVGFYLIFNQSLTVLDGTDASSKTAAAFVLPEIQDAGDTRIHIANPNMAPATLTIELVDGNGALKATPASRNLNANGFVAESISELFPGIVSGGSDYLRVSATQNVVPLELLRKSGHYIQALNGQDAQEGATTLYSPQYAVGGAAWSTALSVINLDSRPGLVTFRLLGNDGAPLANPQVLSIAARGKLHITDQKFFLDPGNVLTQGYVEIKSDGVKLAGSVIFGDPGQSTYSSALPLVSSFPNSLVFSQVASNKDYFTGIAILNPNDAQAAATIEVFRKDGSLLISRQELIPAGGRKSQLLTEYFPSLVGQEILAGYIRITADQGLAAFALFGTGTALSAIPPQILR